MTENKENGSLEHGCNEFGNKDRFVEQHGKRLRYIQEDKQWVVWDGTRWKPDIAAVYQMAEATMNAIYSEAMACDDKLGKKELGRWAERSLSKSAVEHMLGLADKALSVSINQFDTDPEVINCRNGLLNLRTGELSAPSADQYVMKLSDVSYDAGAKAPLWDRSLRDVFEGDDQLIEYVQQLLGYCLTGSIKEHCFFMFYGQGRNGKGTIANDVMLPILGSYGDVTDFEIFLATDKHNVRVIEAVGRMKGRRYVLASETSSNKRLSEALIKKLTGGDKLVGTRLRADSYSFPPTHKLVLLTNHLPAIKDATVGMWERVRVIPFNKQYLGEAQDKQLEAKLLAERDGIFAWLVEGARKYLAAGKLPKLPQVVIDAVQEYRDANDTLSKFINECMVREKGAKAGARVTYDRYVEWWNDVDPIKLRYFKDAMRERGIKSKTTKEGTFYLGVRLKHPNEVPKPAPKFDPDVSLEDYYRSLKRTNWETEYERTKHLSLDDIDAMYE